ncbi:MAG TPA: D-alanyl-D-alanine carboxypeptidase/D-alanyl-D-alanine-endopeptidase [Verrucomicrobiales bacterium]|nr:D-alanyl-D-alanine carboxypeptidase/D-alanyl-D-alanine-endopeptidase [Verrucomicrobiales bacterium]
MMKVRAAFARTARVMLVVVMAPVLSPGFLAWGQRPPEGVRRILRESDFRAGKWGLAVSDLKTGEELWAKNGNRLFVPASVTKLFTVGATLDGLGSDYRFRTPVYARSGPDAEGAVEGPLVLVASGDLTLGGRSAEGETLAFADSDHTYASFLDKVGLVDVDPLAGLDALARQIAAAGVKTVRGGVLVDERIFEPASSSGSGPARVSSFVLNDQVIDFQISPGNAGEPALVDWRPRGAAIVVESRVETGGEGSAPEIRIRRRGGARFELSGTIALDADPLVRIEEMEDPAALGARLFVERLSAAGVETQEGEGSGGKDLMPDQLDGYASWVKLAELVSPPFSENAKVILKVSHNLHASTLPLLLAARNGERDFDAGMRLEGEFLRRAGLDRGEVSFAGGAGGERADRVTPRAAVRFLRYMASHRDAEAYRAALPVLGVDGTLADVVDPGSPARGKVRAKTGTLVWRSGLDGRYLLTSKALSGFLETASGRELVFAIFVNDVLVDDRAKVREAGKRLGKICEILVEAY